MLITTKVCKGCGSQIQATDGKGNPACPICIGINKDSGIVVEINHPDVYMCEICKKERKTKELLKCWKNIPFANPSRGTYYCGCRGWD